MDITCYDELYTWKKARTLSIILPESVQSRRLLRYLITGQIPTEKYDGPDVTHGNWHTRQNPWRMCCWIFWMNIRSFPPPLRRYWPGCPPEPEKYWTWSCPSPPGNSPIPPSSRSIPGVFPNTGCAWKSGSPDILPRKRGKPWTGHGAESSGVSQPAAFFKKPSPKNAERLF